MIILWIFNTMVHHGPCRRSPDKERSHDIMAGGARGNAHVWLHQSQFEVKSGSQLETHSAWISNSFDKRSRASVHLSHDISQPQACREPRKPGISQPSIRPKHESLAFPSAAACVNRFSDAQKLVLFSRPRQRAKPTQRKTRRAEPNLIGRARLRQIHTEQ